MQNTELSCKDWSYLISLSQFRHHSTFTGRAAWQRQWASCRAQLAVKWGRLLRPFTPTIPWFFLCIRYRLNDAHSCSVTTGSQVRFTTPITGYCGVRCHIPQPFQKHAMIPPTIFTIIFPLDAMLLGIRCQVIKQRTLPILGNLQYALSQPDLQQKIAGCRSIQPMYQSLESSLTRYPHVTAVHIHQFIRI